MQESASSTLTPATPRRRWPRRIALAAAVLVLALSGLFGLGYIRQLACRGVRPSFKIIPHERLLFTVSSPLGDAGSITVDVSPLLTLPNSAPAYRITYTFETSPNISAVYVVKGQTSALLDAATLLPIEYEENFTSGLGVTGGDDKHKKLVYDQTNHHLQYYAEDGKTGRLVAKKPPRPIPPDAQHFATMIYYIRDLPMEPGQQLSVVMSDRKNDLTVRAAVLREDNYTALDGSTRKALVLRTVADFGNENLKGSEFEIWLDREFRFPVRLDAKTRFGTISGKLVQRTILQDAASEPDESNWNHTRPVRVDPPARETPP